MSAKRKAEEETAAVKKTKATEEVEGEEEDLGEEEEDLGEEEEDVVEEEEDLGNIAFLFKFSRVSVTGIRTPNLSTSQP